MLSWLFLTHFKSQVFISLLRLLFCPPLCTSTKLLGRSLISCTEPLHELSRLTHFSVSATFASSVLLEAKQPSWCVKKCTIEFSLKKNSWCGTFHAFLLRFFIFSSASSKWDHEGSLRAAQTVRSSQPEGQRCESVTKSLLEVSVPLFVSNTYVSLLYTTCIYRFLLW